MSSEQEQLPSIGKMLQMTFEKWYEDNIPRHAAVLAFYALFALAPILLLCVEVLGIVYGHEEAERRVEQQITSFVNSPETGAWVGTLLGDILPSNANWWITAGFILALFFGATNFFNELKVVLNLIWGVPFAQFVNIKTLAFRRFQAVLMVLAGSFLIFGGFMATAWLTTVTDWATDSIDLGSGYVTFSYLVLIFILLTISFALIYKFVPDIDVAWEDVWIGAAATSLLISITRLLISLYFAHSHTMTMFGAASALVIILLSVYYTAQIFFLGAEFTQVYSRTHGSAHALYPNLGEEASDGLMEKPAPVFHSVNGAGQQRPDEPVEIAVKNLAPVTHTKTETEGDSDIDPTAVERSRFPQRAWDLVRFFRSQSKDAAAPSSVKSPTISPSTTSRPTIELPSADPSSADVPTADLPVNTDAPATDISIPELSDADRQIIEQETSRKPAVRRVFRRTRQVVSLFARAIRPVHDVIVAVGVIGAISVAALVGLPFWKNRDKKIDVAVEKETDVPAEDAES